MAGRVNETPFENMDTRGVGRYDGEAPQLDRGPTIESAMTCFRMRGVDAIRGLRLSIDTQRRVVMKSQTHLTLVCALFTACCSTAAAQTSATEVKLPATELEKLLAPIALYPDVLISQILPASTFPIEIVQAARWLRSKPDMSTIDTQTWDPSVKAICRYPDVLHRLDSDLDRTNALGAAFLSQQQDVMDAIQRLRRQAQAAGALKSTPEQTIVEEQAVVRIVPAEPEVVYVPQYNPTVIYVDDDDDDDVSVGTAAAASAISFGAGLALGAWLDTDCDWFGHRVVHCQPGHWGGWAHRGIVHHGEHWTAAAGPRRAAIAGEHGGAYVGPRGAAVWGENGHGAAWRRPNTYGAPTYSGRYSQYNKASFTKNNVNINRGYQNTGIRSGNNVAAGRDRPDASAGGNRPSTGQRGDGGYANRHPAATPRPSPHSSAFTQAGRSNSARASNRGYQSRGSSATQYPPRGSQASQGPASVSRSSSSSYGRPSARPSSGSSYGGSSFGDRRGSSQTRNYSSRGNSSRGSASRGGSRGGRGGGRGGGGGRGRR